MKLLLSLQSKLILISSLSSEVVFVTGFLPTTTTTTTSTSNQGRVTTASDLVCPIPWTTSSPSSSTSTSLFVSKKEKQLRRQSEATLRKYQEEKLLKQQQEFVRHIESVSSKDTKKIKKLLKNAEHDGLIDIGNKARRVLLSKYYQKAKQIGGDGKIEYAKDMIQMLKGLEKEEQKEDDSGDDTELTRYGLFASGVIEDWNMAFKYAKKMYPRHNSNDDSDDTIASHYKSNKQSNDDKFLKQFAIQAFFLGGRVIDAMDLYNVELMNLMDNCTPGTPGGTASSIINSNITNVILKRQLKHVLPDKNNTSLRELIHNLINIVNQQQQQQQQQQSSRMTELVNNETYSLMIKIASIKLKDVELMQHIIDQLMMTNNKGKKRRKLEPSSLREILQLTRNVKDIELIQPIIDQFCHDNNGSRIIVEPNLLIEILRVYVNVGSGGGGGSTNEEFLLSTKIQNFIVESMTQLYRSNESTIIPSKLFSQLVTCLQNDSDVQTILYAILMKQQQQQQQQKQQRNSGGSNIGKSKVNMKLFANLLVTPESKFRAFPILINIMEDTNNGINIDQDDIDGYAWELLLSLLDIQEKKGMVSPAPAETITTTKLTPEDKVLSVTLPKLPPRRTSKNHDENINEQKPEQEFWSAALRLSSKRGSRSFFITRWKKNDDIVPPLLASSPSQRAFQKQQKQKDKNEDVPQSSFPRMSENEEFATRLGRCIDKDYGSFLQTDVHTLSARLILIYNLREPKSPRDIPPIIAACWKGHQADMRNIYTSISATVCQKAEDAGDLNQQLDQLMLGLDRREKTVRSIIDNLFESFADGVDISIQKEEYSRLAEDRIKLTSSLVEYCTMDTTELLQLISSCKLPSMKNFVYPAIINSALTVGVLSTLTALILRSSHMIGKDKTFEEFLIVNYHDAIVSIKETIDDLSNVSSLEEEILFSYHLYTFYVGVLSITGELDADSMWQKMVFPPPVASRKKNFFASLMDNIFDEPLDTILKDLSEKALVFDAETTSESYKNLVEVYQNDLVDNCDILFADNSSDQSSKLHQALQLGTQESAKGTWYQGYWGRDTAHKILQRLSNSEFTQALIDSYNNGNEDFENALENIYRMTDVFSTWPDSYKEFRRVSRNNCRTMVHNVVNKGLPSGFTAAVAGLPVIQTVKPNFDIDSFADKSAIIGAVFRTFISQDKPYTEMLIADVCISLFEHPDAVHSDREDLIFRNKYPGFGYSQVKKSVVEYLEEALEWYEENPKARNGQHYPKYFDG